MAKMTKAQTAQYERILERLDNARHRIYLFAPNDQTVWSECYKLASYDAKEQWSNAYKERTDFEWQMVNEGRGYFDSFGGFQRNF